MLKRYGFGFYDVLSDLEKIRTTARVFGSKAYPIQLHEGGTRGEYRSLLTTMRKECAALDLENTGELVAFIEAEFEKAPKEYTYTDQVQHLDTLNFSFASELKKKLVFRIADERKKYFERRDLFGAKVDAAFSKCADEIENAGNCYALEQWEASVFHLMRVLERGLSSLATKFGVPFQHDNWHNIIEQIESKIRKMDSTYGPDWKERQKFYSEAASQFMYLKDAWRNHVMHVRDAYDEGRALSILGHVQELMQALEKGGLKE